MLVFTLSDFFSQISTVVAVSGDGDNKSSTNDGKINQFHSNCPALEDINLQKNLLVSLPCDVFTFPSLKKLNVSFNKITVLPFELWTSTSLVDLNLSHNRLASLQCVDRIQTPVLCDHSISFTGIESSSPGSLQTSRQLSNLSSDVNIIYPQTSSSGVSSPGRSADTLSTPQGALSSFTDIMVMSVSRWQDKVKVQSTIYDDSRSEDGSVSFEKQSQLKELNLSYNLLVEVPTGLSCLTPKLEKLCLSHNKLTQVGAIQLYPAGLRSLDLSHNEIICDVLFDCRLSQDINSGSPPSWFSPTCSSPFQSKR